MNSRSTIKRQPSAINTDVANTPTTSASFSTSMSETPISPPFSQDSFDQPSIGRNKNSLPELEG
jgi:hypothetical protein